jgi:hypothetical protein
MSVLEVSNILLEMLKEPDFWLDTWAGECPLKITFPSIFTIYNQQEWSVHRVLNSDQLNLTFRRNFGDIENQEYIELREMMSEIQLTNSHDSVRWILVRSGNFTTFSLYNELTFTGFSDRLMQCLWKTKVPLKIKIFFWQVIHEKIQSAEQLKKENGLDLLNVSCVGCMNLQHISSLSV